MNAIQTGAPPWPGIEATWRAHADTGATFGSMLELELPPGGSYEVHRHADVERVVYLERGAGLHRGVGGAVTLEAGEVLVLPPGSWHGFENVGDSPARLWLIYSPSTAFPSGDYEGAGSSARYDGELIKHRLRDVPQTPEITTPERGFIDLEVIWDGASGAENVTLGLARFKAGARHLWHRHPRGDEVIYIVSGESHHVTDERDEVLRGPAFDFSPANEWHMMPVEEPVECIFVYIGGASLDEVGYERREDFDG